MGETMIRLAELAKQYQQVLLDTYPSKITKEHRYALNSLIQCRTPASGEMRYDCEPCDQHQSFYHSCGHRSCPQCQHLSNSQWLAKQQQKLLPVSYSMVTMTLPYQLRAWVWKQQKTIYPLFFKAKFLTYLKETNIVRSNGLPKKWIVQCQSVGKGEPALKYLARYLYRGVINEKNILKLHNNIVTFRYKDSETKAWKVRTETAVEFLWLVLQHVLPKGLRRVRDYGYLHGNAKSLLNKVQLQLKVRLDNIKPVVKKERCCPKCHAVMLFTPFFRKRISLKIQSG